MPGADPQLNPESEFLYSPAVSGTANATFGLSGQLTWDSWIRGSYKAVGDALDRQAAELVRRGNFTHSEVRHLVETQRNGLVLEMRRKLSPWGRRYSELLKSRNNLPTLEGLLRKKGTLGAVLASVGKTRGSVNRFAAVFRIGGPATIVVQVSFSGVIIATAEDPERAAAGQAGAIGGATAGGIAGAWAGCAALSAIVSPSLVIPVVGPVSTGTACMVGGAAGGFGGGFLGGWLGEIGGEKSYDYFTRVKWES